MGFLILIKLFLYRRNVMTTKEELKEEIDCLPSNLLKDVHQFISSIKKEKETKGIHSFKLKGQFDKIDIRKEAYE